MIGNMFLGAEENFLHFSNKIPSIYMEYALILDQALDDLHK
jgi:hypothetical protein